MPQQLPAHPNLDHLRKQAKDVLRMLRRQNPRWKLADAQRAIARGYGFVNWPSLRTHVQKIRHEQGPSPSPWARALEPDDSAEAKAPPRHAESAREDCPVHPMAGAWVAARVLPPAHGDPPRPNDDIVVEFQVSGVSGEEIRLTQVATDATGQAVAVTTTICADGHEHPAPFGDDVRLSAPWTTSRVLEATFKTNQRTLGSWSYEVSPDGESLVIATTGERIVFRRL